MRGRVHSARRGLTYADAPFSLGLVLPSPITCLEDLRVLVEKCVPRMFHDDADSGSWTASTYRANAADFDRIKLRQLVAVDMTNRSLASTMIG